MKCSLVWQPMSITMAVCRNHTWAKKSSASGFTCLSCARGEPDFTSEPLGEASEIKTLRVMRQKLVFSVGGLALMRFQKHSITFPLLLTDWLLSWPHNKQRWCFLLSFYMVGPGSSSQCSVTSVNPFLLIFSVIRRVLWQDLWKRKLSKYFRNLINCLTTYLVK